MQARSLARYSAAEDCDEQKHEAYGAEQAKEAEKHEPFLPGVGRHESATPMKDRLLADVSSETVSEPFRFSAPP